MLGLYIKWSCLSNITKFRVWSVFLVKVGKKTESQTANLYPHLLFSTFVLTETTNSPELKNAWLISIQASALNGWLRLVLKYKRGFTKSHISSPAVVLCIFVSIKLLTIETENLVMLSALAWPPLSNPRGFHMVASLPCRKQGAMAVLCFKDSPLKKVPASYPWDDPLPLPTGDPDLKYPCSHSPKTKKCSMVLRCLDRSWLINKAVF